MACRFLFAEEDEALAERFFQEFYGGSNLAENSPTFKLRGRILANLGSKAKLPQHEILAIVIKAWNYFRDGSTCNVLRWNPQEEYPVLRGPRR